MKAGKDRISVLRDMSERAGVPDVASFVTVLIQSASFGTSIADALRVYASEMRDKRVMRAEEKANTLPTKMTLATMMLTVPPLLVILVGPSVYGIGTTLSGSRYEVLNDNETLLAGSDPGRHGVDRLFRNRRSSRVQRRAVRPRRR